MDDTPNLGLPYIMAAQSQKHVTHNEAIRALDALVQLAVLDRDLTAPPSSPADGARYIVGGSPTGAWSGHAGSVAAYQDGAWMFYVPAQGWIAWIGDEDAAVVWDGAGWSELTTGGGGGGGGSGSFTTLGVNATADTTNRLTLSADATLLNHDGDGHQLKINKASASDTASLLYQDAFSGRAELGLAGDDDFRFKVSPDGSVWKEAIVIDRSSGAVSFPFTTFSGGGGAGGGLVASGRLTLTSGVPVLSTTVSGATTIYYTPHIGNGIPIYDGTTFVATEFAELSNATAQSSTGKAGPAAVAANANYDLFVWNDAGTLRLTRGPLWTSSTARGTGSGTSELQRIKGTLTNKIAIANGPGANLGTYVGTARSNGSSQIDWTYGGLAAGGTAGFFGVWNMYNRVDVVSLTNDSTGSWNQTGGVTRAANASNAMRTSFVSGLAEDMFYSSYACLGINGAAGNFSTGVGSDSTTTNSGRTCSGNGTAFAPTFGDYGATYLGFHFHQALETNQTSTTTWWAVPYSSPATQGGIFFTGRM